MWHPICNVYSPDAENKIAIEYLKSRGWIINDDSAYLSEDKEFQIRYSIEGTYKLYMDKIIDYDV
jgi:hypothetical protein